MNSDRSMQQKSYKHKKMLIPIFRSKTYAKIKSLLPTVIENKNAFE